MNECFDFDDVNCFREDFVDCPLDFGKSFIPLREQIGTIVIMRSIALRCLNFSNSEPQIGSIKFEY